MKNHKLLFLFTAVGLATTPSIPTACAETAGALRLNTQTNQPIPWSEVGAKATAQYSGDGLTVFTVSRGAVRLRCAFQRLEGEVTDQGLWLTSRADGQAAGRFRVVAEFVGRNGGAMGRLAERGAVVCAAGRAEFSRRGLREEYYASVDGVRQDFVVLERPTAVAEAEARQRLGVRQPSGALEVVGGRERQRAGAVQDHSAGRSVPDEGAAAGDGGLRVELAVTGAKVEALMNGARLVLDGSGRKLAYNRLRVVDAQGHELPARMEVAAANRLALVVDDAAAVYPVRIDPTFSDANWVSMGVVDGADGEVWAAVFDGSGNLYIGGDFRSVAGVSANFVAKWDGSAWSAFGSGMDRAVRALAVSGGDLYAGGYFTEAGGVPANSIAKWDGSNWSALGSGLFAVSALAVSGADLYATSGLQVAKWNGSTWILLPEMDGEIKALAVMGGDLYAGGTFVNAGGVQVNGIAKWSGSAWSALGERLDGNGTVLSLAVSGSDLYAGGSFSWYGSAEISRIARWNGSSWSALGAGIGPYWPTVRALAIAGNDLFVGGDFTTAGGVSANNIAKWNGSAWTGLNPGMDLKLSVNGPVYALAVSGHDLYVGGSFSTAGGSPAYGIAKWDGRTWSALGEGIGGTVLALAVLGNDLYAGGSSIAKWNGSTWSALGSGLELGTGPDVGAVAISGSNVYVGGIFAFAGGVPANGIAKWDGNSRSALGGGVGGGAPWVYALASFGNDIYAGGDFTEAGGVPANRIAKWNGSSWSALGLGMDNGVETLAVFGSDIYAGGYFTTADGIPANRVAKWNGNAWSTLGSGLSGALEVRALAISRSELFVGGSFSVAGGKVSANISRAYLITPPGGIADSITAARGTATIKFYGNPGHQFDVLRATNLAPPVVWTTLNTSPLSPAADGLFTFTDNTATNGTAYYRSVEK